MRPKIHGWMCGCVIFGAGCLGIAARAVCDPPRSAPDAGVQSAGELSVTPLATPKPAKTPRLLTPPSHAGADGPAVKDDSQQTIRRISYEYPNGEQAGNYTSQQSGSRRPVSQFVRQASGGDSDPQQPVDSRRQDQRPSVYQPGSGQVPANIGQVEVQGLDQLGVIILRGNPQDVENMKKIIEEIQKISEAVEPYVRVFQLKRATASAVRDTIQELYAGATGTTSASTRSTTGQGGGGQGGGAGQATAVVPTPALKRFQIAADDRSNTLVVSASPQMMEELARLIDRLDVDGAPMVNEVRVFQLKNAEATEVTNILTQAIAGQSASTTGATLAPTTGGASTAGTVSGGGEAKIGNRAAVVKLVPIEGETRAVQSGIMDYVLVTAQIRTNSVIVSAPSSSMLLLAALIAELDKPPSIVASMKVFPLKNADATNMRQTLQELFDLEPTSTTGGGAGGGAFGATSTQFQRPIAVGPGDSPPVSIRVAVDERTNSLIVTGPENSILQVEAVIRKLDLSDIHNRKTSVYRLKNVDAEDVATAVQSFYTNKRTNEGQQAGVTAGGGTIVGAYQQLEQYVVVVAVPNNMAGRLMSATVSPVGNASPAAANTQGVSNTLLVSASPRYYDQVMQLIEELDAAQPQVMIQCIIAQLTLNDDFEFGIEFGLQNDALFGRGDLASNPLNPGFNFNSTDALPNSTIFRPAQTGSQGLSNLSLGRASLMDGLGAAGGMVLTASSKNISAMLRALQGNRQLEIISRPQIMTMDGRTARVFVGENFPYLGAINTQNLGSVTQEVDYQPIGTSLTVKPSITPDNRIYLEIVPEITELKELVEFSTLTTRQQAPRTSVTAANTVVSVNSGQTIVLAGLIQKRHTDFTRKIPWLGDLPCVGFLFRYSQNREQKQELLIFMTPHIVRNEADAQRIKEAEMARMNWIVSHSAEIHGDLGLTPAESEVAPEPTPNSTSSAPSNQPVIGSGSVAARPADTTDGSFSRPRPTIRLMNLEAADPEPVDAPQDSAAPAAPNSGAELSSKPVPDDDTNAARKSLRERIRRRFSRS